MNRYDLSGQVAVITGGSQGIGAEVARLFSASGAKVAIWDAQGTAPKDLSGAPAFVCDVSDWESVQSAQASTEAEFGPITTVVNSAGLSGPNKTVEDYDNADWRHVTDVNLTGTYHVNKVVIPGMKAANYGRIVNIASIAGKEGNPNAGAYSASKAGVIGLTKSLGKELAGHDIAVNCVTPAAARTPIFAQMTDEHIQYMLSKIPRGRFLEVSEAASMIAWLASPENSFATGAVFDLSGGRATY